MRTTLSLDDDIMLAVKERARRERRSAGEVLSDLARQALTQGQGSEEGGEVELHGFRPFPPSGAVVSNDAIDGLRDDGPY